MIYIKFNGKIPVAFSHEMPSGALYDKELKTWQSRWDWKSYEHVCNIARLLEATTAKKFLGIDNGSHHTPRYDVIEPPKVGDEVSYSFNGDTYPDGVIVKITPTYQITTDTGHRYLRRKNSGSWLRTGGTWSLIPGHIYEQNPSF